MKAAEAIGNPRPSGAAAPAAPGADRAEGAERAERAERGGRLAAELARQRHVAVELQHAILPLHHEPFDLPGLQAFVKYLPASSADRVGGDWYITAEMPDDRVLIAIGDVAGHGLAAAAGMTRLRGALAGLAFTGSPPGRLAERPGPARGAGAHRLGDRRVLPSPGTAAHLGAGRPPAAAADPRRVRPGAGPARGHPARRRAVRLSCRDPATAGRRPAAALQ